MMVNKSYWIHFRFQTRYRWDFLLTAFTLDSVYGCIRMDTEAQINLQHSNRFHDPVTDFLEAIWQPTCAASVSSVIAAPYFLSCHWTTLCVVCFQAFSLITVVRITLTCLANLSFRNPIFTQQANKHSFPQSAKTTTGEMRSRAVFLLTNTSLYWCLILPFSYAWNILDHVVNFTWGVERKGLIHAKLEAHRCCTDHLQWVRSRVHVWDAA